MVDLSAWRMPPEILSLIERILAQCRCKTLLELGSGESTKHFSGLVAAGELDAVHSIEHLADWVEYVQPLADYATVHHCPLLGDSWYDLRQFKPGIQFNALIVDGPPGHLLPGGMARMPAIARLREYLTPDALIFLDDAQRPGERAIAKAWQNECTRIADHGRLAVFRLRS